MPAAQAPAVAPRASDVARTPEGHPDLQGVVWVTGPDSVLYTGDLETGVADEEARIIQGQNLFPASSLVIHPPDGLIPYQPWAAARRETLPHQLKAILSEKGAESRPIEPRDAAPIPFLLRRHVSSRRDSASYIHPLRDLQWDWTMRTCDLRRTARIHSNSRWRG